MEVSTGLLNTSNPELTLLRQHNLCSAWPDYAANCYIFEEKASANID